VATNGFPWPEVMSALGGGGVVGAALRVGKGLLGAEGRHVKALSSTVDTLSDQLTKADERQERFEGRLERAEADLAECHDNHKRCEEGREEDRKAHREEIAAIRAEVAKALAESGPPAEYKPANLRRVGPAKRAGGERR
jgi:hypothetical protein